MLPNGSATFPCVRSLYTAAEKDIHEYNEARVIMSHHPGTTLILLMLCLFALCGCPESPADQHDVGGHDTSPVDTVDTYASDSDPTDSTDTVPTDSTGEQDSTDAVDPNCLDGPWMLSSPDGRVVVELTDAPGSPVGTTLRYRVLRDGDELLRWSPLGISTDRAAWVTDLCVTGAVQRTVSESYQMTVGKQLSVSFEGDEHSFTVRNRGGDELELLFGVHDDGVAFRYRIVGDGEATVTGEESGFAVPLAARGWMMPYDIMGLMAGSYEVLPRLVTAGDTVANSQGWAFPALFEVGDGENWLLLTEADLDGSYCGVRLHEEPVDAVYRVRFPSEQEGRGVGEVLPRAALPLTTPWRVAIVGDLSTVVESTLVTDLSRPALLDDTAWILPGRVAWSWFSQGTGDPALQRAYIVFAARMGWEYVLVDAGWDEWPQAEEQVRQLVQLAGESDVSILLWYNSGGEHSFNQNATPMDRMLDAEVRRAEMERLREWGVAGIKVDFFDSDKQDRIQQYIAILEDAADAQLLVNFHGATLPRGWQRTYPHLMSHEAVHGAENYKWNLGPPDAWHHVFYVFARNVVGSMDYTPVVFSAAYEGQELTYAHSLALSVLFESGLQHFADRADGNVEEGYGAVFAAYPFVEDFMREVPVAWDETLLLEGAPDTYVALARRRGDSWWLAAINGLEQPATASPSLSFLGEGSYRMSCILRGETATELAEQVLTVEAGQSLELVMAVKDGVVCVLRPL